MTPRQPAPPPVAKWLVVTNNAAECPMLPRCPVSSGTGLRASHSFALLQTLNRRRAMPRGRQEAY